MDRFFGRKNELAKLARIFSRAKKGHTRAVLVSGTAGSGKTALVSRFAVEAEKERALFIYGKADPFFHTSPFSTVIAAMNMLVKKAVAAYPDAGEEMKRSIRRGLSPVPDRIRASLLNLIPALDFFFGDTRGSLTQSDKQDNQSFNLGLFLLLEAFATTLKRPLVLFLDDLQWMDTASHGFLHYLAINARLSNVMQVMAFRSQTAQIYPSLERTIRLYQKMETTLVLPLSGLTKRDTRGLLRQHLATDQVVDPLADICHHKTAGNPFYLEQMLDDLLEKKVVYTKDGEWVYDISYISGLDFTENVADLIIRRINLLDKDCLALIKQAACIHGDISIQLLTATSGYTREKIETLLWKPVQQDLLRKTDNGYAFAHDKILESVQALLSEDEAREVHRRLVAFYLAKEQRGNLEANIFTLLYHYGFCSRSITDPYFKRDMSRLYYLAGKKAQNQSAYDLAQEFFIKGKEHFPDKIWANEYGLALKFCRRIARCAYLAGDIDAADRVFKEVDANARSFGDRLETEMIKIPIYQAQQKEDQALGAGMEILRHLGIRLPENPARPVILYNTLKAWLRFILSPKDRLRRKRMDQDTDVYKVVQCLNALGAIAYSLSPQRLLPLMSVMVFNLTLKHGNMHEAPVCYVAFGMILNELTGGVTWGRRLGAMARKISRDFSDDRHKVKEMTLINVYLIHWDKPLVQVIRGFEEAERFCLRQGDHEYFGYNAVGYLHCLVMSGMSLDRVLQHVDEKKKVFERLNNQSALTMAGFIQQALVNLGQDVSEPWILTGDFFEEARLDHRISGITTEFYLYKFYAAFYSGRPDMAADIREILISNCDERAIDIYQYGYYQFLSALVDIHLNREKKKIKAHLKRLKKYAAHNSAIYGNKYLLALGDMLRIKGDSEAAMIYREAAAAAQKYGFRFEQALAHEGLGRAARDKGDEAAAHNHFSRAISLYRQWGLKWKQGVFYCDPDTDDLQRELRAMGKMRVSIGVQGPADPGKGSLKPVNHRKIETTLQSIKSLCEASVVHGAIRIAQRWKSWVYIDRHGIHQPATFVPLPEKMLNFACATNAIVRAGADSTNEQFFDLIYYWKKSPSALMVVPLGMDRSIYIENYKTIPDEDHLKQLAKTLFVQMNSQATARSGLTITPRSDPVVHQKNCLKLQDAMEFKNAYVNPRLTLTSFARDVGLSQRAVTDAIGICLGQNFRAFVNSYRIEAVKQALNDPSNSHKTILEIAFALGFNSKSTFNDVFKQMVGTTPSEYRGRLNPKEAC